MVIEETLRFFGWSDEFSQEAFDEEFFEYFNYDWDYPDAVQKQEMDIFLKE